MPAPVLIDQLSQIATKRLGGNLRLLALYGSAADRPLEAHDLDFFLVVDAVENCVTHATRDCRDLFPQVQFFVLSAEEYAVLPGFFRFQFAFARQLAGDLTLPLPSREDAMATLRTLRNAPGSKTKEQRRAALALLDEDPSEALFLLRQVLAADSDPGEVTLVRGYLAPHLKTENTEHLWGSLLKSKSAPDVRLREAAVLVALARDDTRWGKAAKSVVDTSSR